MAQSTLLEYLHAHIESLLFAAGQPLSADEIAETLTHTFDTPITTEAVELAIQQSIAAYQEPRWPFEVVAVGSGYQFLTKPAYHGVVATFLRQNTRKRLSQAALETLAIIAYKQPISKGEAEQIRGVNCDYSIQKLLDKDLIAIIGRSDGPGRPLLYGTTDKFMQYFGIRSVDDLPKPKEFAEPESSIGATPTEEEFMAILPQPDTTPHD